ncbi:MAG: transketolase C-terminal domain-containing protein [Pseudomonadota bacterium]|nr:transketolase C-terminal domain-containing protein [Pseudomonadota bacterium]
MTNPRAMRDALLEQILQRMKTEDDIYFVSADYGSPVLDHIRNQFPNRFLNVGVAEQNLINISAGLSLEGFRVFAYAIAPFLTMRCFEQLRVNLALLSEVREINVNLIGVGAGYSYVVSGPTHQCYEDISLIRSLPNFQLYSPSDHILAGSLIERCLEQAGPKYLRLDAQVLPPLRAKVSPDATDDGFEVLKEGKDGLIFATGFMTHTALEVAAQAGGDGKQLAVVDLFNLTSLNLAKFRDLVLQYRHVFSFEEGFEGRGGMDVLINTHLKSSGYDGQFDGVGVRPGYSFELGDRQSIHEKVGIGLETVLKRVLKSYSR